MNEREFYDIVTQNRESHSIEFKSGGTFKDKQLKIKVIRAMMGMANRRDGGYVVLGVTENRDGTPNPNGLSTENLATWKYDDVADYVAEYVDPYLSFDLKFVEYSGKNFLVIIVEEFEDIPVLCKKDYGKVLRKGACYVRSRKKPETVEIPSQADMRDLLDLAIEKGVRKFVTRARNSSLSLSDQPPPTDEKLFNEQVVDFLGEEQ